MARRHPCRPICPQEGNARIMAAGCPVLSLSLSLSLSFSFSVPLVVLLVSSFSPGKEKKGKRHHQREGKRRKNGRAGRGTPRVRGATRRQGERSIPLYPRLTEFGLVGQFEIVVVACARARARARSHAARNLNPPTIGNRRAIAVINRSELRGIVRARVWSCPPTPTPTPPVARRPGIHG